MRRRILTVMTAAILVLTAGTLYAPTWPCNEENWAYTDGRWGADVYWERIDCNCNYSSGPPWSTSYGTFLRYTNYDCNTSSGYSVCYSYDGGGLWTQVDCES
jgi:hypothetical protein